MPDVLRRWTRRRFLALLSVVVIDPWVLDMATLSYTPSPVPGGTTATAAGSGFASLPTRLRLDGVLVADLKKPARGGIFRVGVPIPAVAAPQTARLSAWQKKSGSWIEVTAIPVLVSVGATVPVPPTPDPEEPPPVVTPDPPPPTPPPPTPDPDPTPPPTPPPDPPAPPGGNPTFGTRTSASPGSLNVSGGSSVSISGKSFNGGTRDSVGSTIGITIMNVNGTISIVDCDFQNLIGGIYIYNCSGTLNIQNVRMRNIGNITMTSGSVGSGKCNHIQLAECSFTGFIRDSQFLGGQTEDMISTWHSGGRGVGQELVIQDNRIQGLVTTTATARAWDRTSGTGIIISDGGGSAKNGYIIVRRNSLLTPGQVGIQHIDGPGIQTYENIIYGERRPQNNNPMTSWEGNPRGVVHDNRYKWQNNDGSYPTPWFGGGGSLVWDGGTFDSTLQASDYAVTLA